MSTPLTIIGAGNIGRALAQGLVARGICGPAEITLTRRQVARLDDLAADGFITTADNQAAVIASDTIVVAVKPQQLDAVLDEISPSLDPARHVLVSVVSGAAIADMAARVPQGLPVVRAMPNTAMALGQSMTCLAANDIGAAVLPRIEPLFGALGETLVVREEMMVPATALGAASLVLQEGNHPERQIDHVTTPRGCTIAGLNETEHAGLSSAMIKGIVTAAEKAASLYKDHD